MNRPEGYGEDVALFIDWENFKISLAGGHRTPNVSALKEEVSNHGRVVVAKAYADWVTRAPELRGASQFINDPPALYAAGIEPVYVPTRLPGGGSFTQESTRTVRVKNSVDVKMTADCIECAHSYPNIGTFVLVSGDSDFIHVINALRTMGKRAVIIGVSWATSRRLSDQVDALILYDVDVDPVTPPEPAAPVANGRTVSRSGGPSRRELPEVTRAIEELIQTERQAGRTPLLTSLKQRLMRRFPGFDEKKLGFSGFKKLVLRTAQEGKIKLVTVGLVDWVIMADEPDPQEVIGEPIAENGTAPEESAILEGEPQDLELTPTDAADSSAEPAEEAAEEPAEAPVAVYGEAYRAPGEPAVESTEAAVQEVVDSEDEAVARLPGELDGVPELSPVALEEAEPAEAEPAESEPAESEPAEAELAEAESMEEGDDVGAVWTPSPDLVTLAGEVMAEAEIPKASDDDQDPLRIIDLVVMADTLENSEGVGYVAFNFLVSEVGDALSQGIEAQHPEITRRWGQVYSRNYVTRLVRSLGNGDVFMRGWYNDQDEETGKSRRRRTFQLNHGHPLVERVLVSRGGMDEASPEELTESDEDPEEAPVWSEGPDREESSHVPPSEAEEESAVAPVALWQGNAVD